MASHSTTPLLDEQLAASTLGTYAPNHAIIRLSRDASYWLDENEPTLDRLAVFIHEYAHYLHNFSTTSGIYGFIASLRSLVLFMNTVDETGKSLGTDGLSAEFRRELSAINEWRSHLSGSSAQPFDMRGVAPADLQVVDVSRQPRTVETAAQRIPVHGVSITLGKRTDPASKGTVILGTHILMEGIAWEIERLLFAAHGKDVATLDSRVPTWPYKVPRSIFEFAVGRSLSFEQMAKLLVLSLLSTDPGDAFLSIVDIYKTNALSESDDDILERLRAVTVKDLTEKTPGMVESLGIEADRFSPRPTLHRGVKAMMEWAIAYLQLRGTDTFFELNVIRAANRDALVEMLKKFPPCPIIQETGPHSQDLEMFFISDRDPDRQRVNDLGVTQSLFHFASAHTSSNGFVPTARAREGLCRFFGACKLPLAMSSPQVCRRRPWESFDPQARDGCWYAGGVRLSRSVNRSPS